ncbi:hypothetical protein BB561_003185 [Smittium simulii]|uniref:Uncharacterized protein n=1 Tax=Smittium simulii TaxID=133385 RepID=A0A2T9YMQ5_9FUNG|nr:hypothetical protein BB561_003185 [Smittium simulii]
MGISGLLPLTKEAQNNVHISQFSGKTLGIDGYVWLYKGAFSCCQDIALGIPTKRHIQYSLNQIKMLSHFGVSCYFVFDGNSLPSKIHTDLERASSKKINLEKALSELKNGRKKDAFSYFQRSINMSPLLAKDLIDELKKLNIKYVVAPYEADAQLAYLERVELIDGIITEDSDLIAYGCKKIIYKLDIKGSCVLFDRSLMSNIKQLSFKGWDDDLFRKLCILSGCDYLPAVPGIGIKRSYKYLLKSKNIQKLVQILKIEGFNVPQNYVDEFQRAEKTFLYQKVYDPIQKKIISLEKIRPEHISENLDYSGVLVDDDLAFKIATGEIDPVTMTPFNISHNNENIKTDYKGIKPIKQVLLTTWVQPNSSKQSKLNLIITI